MHILAIVSACVVALALASLLAVYSYGRFAERARGAPSTALPPEGEATALDTMVAPLLQRHSGSSGLMLLSANLHAFAVRAHSARCAGRSLDLQYYYWLDDLTGGLLAKEVVAAAERGVRVRLLLDDINTGGRDTGYLALDSHPNIEVRLFNPSRNRENALRRGIEMLLRVFRTTRRMHNKAWIADGRVAIVGGRNIGDAYFDASETSNFRDMDLLLVGPAVAQAEAIFDSYWNSAAVIPMKSLAGSRKGDFSWIKSLLHKRTTAAPAAPYLLRLVEQTSAENMLADEGRLHWSHQVKVVSDPPDKALGAAQERWLSHTIFPMLVHAKANLEVVSPYFIPGDEGVRRLLSLVGMGVSVSVLTNSLAATDVAAVHGAYANYRKRLIEGGVKLFELRPEAAKTDMSLFGSRSASLHTKAFTVDQTAGFIGSFNFDPRSASLNTEMGVLYEDPNLAAEVHAEFAARIAPENSYQVQLKDGHLVWEDIVDGRLQTWTREPRAGIWRRMTATVIGYLPIESQL